MLGKDCNSNPISTFLPCYAFQMIFTAFAPRLIQSISSNVHIKTRALKRLCVEISTNIFSFAKNYLNEKKIYPERLLAFKALRVGP